MKWLIIGENLWHLDRSKTYIYYGIMDAFAMGLMIDSLINHMNFTKKSLPYTKGMEYSFGDRARLVLDRDEQEDGMKVYLHIADLFPYSAGLMADISSLYLHYKEIDKSEKFVKKAFSLQGLDEISYAVAWNFYRKTFQSEKVLENLKKLIEISHKKKYKIYETAYKGLLDYYNNGNEWRGYLTKAKKLGLDGDESYWVSVLLDSTLTKDRAKKILSMNSDYKRILHEMVHKKFPNDIDMVIRYIAYFIDIGLYEDALKNLNSIDVNLFNVEQKEMYQMYMAFTLYEIDPPKSIAYWLPILDFEDEYSVNAANYFLGMSYLSKNEGDVAMKYFNKIKDKNSKYATLARMKLYKEFKTK